MANKSESCNDKPAYKPGVLSYGCDHIRMSMTSPRSIFVQNYKQALVTICNQTPVRSQHYKDTQGKVVTRLEALYLCLQCDTTVPFEQLDIHGEEKKHKLFVESRTGNVYCNMCRDYVYDPTLEALRTRKVETGSGGNPRKRKPDEHADLFKESTIREMRLEASKPTCNTTSVRGIWNMGVSCYMTSVLEAVVGNPLIRNFYLGDGHKPATCHKALADKSCLSCNFDDMFQQYHNTESTIAFSAHQILGSLMNSTKNAYAGLVPNVQQDAHEFLNYVLEELHDVNSWQPGDDDSDDSGRSSPKRRKVDVADCKCVVHQTFYGKTSNVTKCQGEVNGKKCGHISAGSPEMFSDLSLGLSLLPPGKKHSLEYCLKKEYFTEEKFEWTCDECGSKSATKQVSIKTLPNVLCIQLKRFAHTAQTSSKNKTKVSFPLKLEMLPYTDKHHLAAGHGSIPHTLKTRSTYHLQSVIAHIGDSIDQGHYVAYSKYEGQWFQFDDHKVYLASKSEVLNVEAYMMFYVIQALASTEEGKV